MQNGDKQSKVSSVCGVHDHTSVSKSARMSNLGSILEVFVFHLCVSSELLTGPVLINVTLWDLWVTVTVVFFHLQRTHLFFLQIVIKFPCHDDDVVIWLHAESDSCFYFISFLTHAALILTFLPELSPFYYVLSWLQLFAFSPSLSSSRPRLWSWFLLFNHQNKRKTRPEAPSHFETCSNISALICLPHMCSRVFSHVSDSTLRLPTAAGP